MKSLFFALLALAAFSQLSCKLNDYCLECGKGDGGPIIDAQPIDSQVDARDANPCVPTGLAEECNGKDDDCNGLVDDNVPTVGDACANQMGECAGGKITCDPTFHCSVTITTACIDANDTISCPTGELCKDDGKSTDRLSCDKRPTPEVCDNKDNNCNGTIDEGDPSDTVHAAGARCGNGTGTCVQGTYHCLGACVGQADGCTAGTDTVSCSGGTGPGTESCDGLDNDCDGTIDNNVTGLGTCGTSTVGVCHLGSNACVGGNVVCQNAVNPGFETCNGSDDDCNGKVDDPYTDVNGVYNVTAQNCGGCNQICGSSLANDGNANWTCTAAGTCAIASCKSGFHNNNNNPSDGCEFGACFVSGPEQCDGVDNDCDGVIDEAAAIGSAPAICATVGECKGAVAACPCKDTADSGGCTTGGTCVTTCSNMAGWTCNYPSTVTVTNGVIQDELTCDGLDNDCNGVIDDNQSEMKHTTCAGYVVGSASSCPFTAPACGDSKLGECHGTGTYRCDSANRDGAAECNVSSPGASSVAESCNNKDDDCDGVTDEGTNLGNLDGPTHNDQLWVDIGGGHQMMKYEASRPDADGSTAGNVSATTCAKLTIAASPGGATETSTTVTITTSVPHGLKTGDRVVIANVAAGGAYDGTFYVTSVPTSTTFTYTTTAGLAASGGGTVGIHCPVSITGASESGSTVTITTGVDHALSVGQAVIVAGVTNASYNGTYVITSVPTTTTFKYTSSSTGLTASSGGTVAANAVATCAKSGSLPWTNVSYPQALAACQAVGATLCTDQEWHRSCSANGTAGNNRPTVYPLAYSGTGVLIEAEDYFNNSYATDGSGTTRSWVENTTSGFFGISDMIAQPNTGTTITSTNAPAQAPRLDYQMTFGTTSANYHVCVHMYANSVNDNSIYVGVNSSLPGTANATALANSCATYPCWSWISSPALSITAGAGSQFVSLYMAQDGVKVDALFVVNGACPAGLTNASENGTVNGKGFQWAMQPTPNYTANVCNDQSYTGTGSGAAIATGTLTSCYADDSGLKSGSTSQQAFDMSGNVREWTLSHQPGQNPIRGGSFIDTKIGIDCPNNFLLADDKFFLPNIGFRCCR